MAPPNRRSGPIHRILTGDKEIDKALAEIAKVGTANRIARSGLTKGIRVGVKAMRSEVPSKAKSVKKALNGYVKRQKKTGINIAKLGAVGKQTKNNNERSTKEGVGIAGQNVHWYVLGTKVRRVKSKEVMKTKLGRFMGKEVAEMPSSPVVKEGWAKSKSEVQRTIREGVKAQLFREVSKAKTKAGVK
jgi:hypothetical protein